MTNPSALQPRFDTSPRQDSRAERVTPDLARLKTWMVNLYFAGTDEPGEFVLIDAGLPGWAGTIAELAEDLYGTGARPRAIILTHGHFDHVGNLHTLADKWDVPIFAHPLELPYLTGQSDYPPADPSVGGGMMARTGFLYPRRAIDVRPHVQPLPADGTVPFLPEYRWIHTPGHCPGHVSFFRERDRLLIAGDAFITTKQESLISVVTQQEEMHGPPMYFTTDWIDSRDSVRRLADLSPDIAATGHGPIMRGERLRDQLHWLADNFTEVAVPSDGRYVREPARADERGTYYIPPPVADPVTTLMIAGMVVGIGAALYGAVNSVANREED